MKPEERYKNLAAGIERNIEKLKLQLETNGTPQSGREPVRRGRQPEKPPSVRRPIRRGGAASKANEPVLNQLTAEYERLRQVRLDYVLASQQMHQQRKTTLMKERQDDIVARQKEFEEEVEKRPRKARNNSVTPLEACKKLLRILERVNQPDLSDDEEDDAENLPEPSETENTETVPVYGPSVTPDRILETPMGSYIESDDEVEVLRTISTTPSIASTTPSMISATTSTEYVTSPSPMPGRGTPRGTPRGMTPVRAPLRTPPPPRGRAPPVKAPPQKPAWGRPPAKPPVKPPVGTPRERAKAKARAAATATPTTPTTPVAPIAPPIPAPLGGPPPPVTKLEPLGLPKPVKPVVTKEDLTITVVRMEEEEEDYEDIDADIRDPLDKPDPNSVDTTMLVIPLAVRELFWIAEIEAPVCHSEIEDLITQLRTKLELEEND